MKPKVYERTLRVPYFLCDRHHKMTLPHLMSVLIEISGEQTAKLKGPKAEEYDLHWIIIQYKLEINRMPDTNENITVKTYAKEFNRIFSYREFDVYDEEGNLLLHVLTVFALMDEDRKLSRIPAEIGQQYGSKESKRIQRLPRPDKPENLKAASHKNYNVRYFDIDGNFHANNSMYYEWMLDAMEDEFLATHAPVYGNIVFEKEVHIGEVVESYVDFIVDENEQLISRHQIKVDDVSKCVGTFKWIENGISYTKETE